MGNPTTTQAWQRLQKLEELSPGDKVAKDVISYDCVSIDFSKSLMSGQAWDHLIDIARTQNVEEWRDKMFNGEPINKTENRAVLHTALRSGTHADVQNILKRMKDFVSATHTQSGFTDIVHIGIGGSDLGPRLVCDALKHLPQKMRVHFVSNVDGADIEETLKPLNQKTTLFVVASKTFTTQETMMNAAYAKQWLGSLPIVDHMIALSTNEKAVTDFGIAVDRMFPFWDWVGGRFSVWSSIGMPIALGYGFDAFQSFLDGARSMDDHFVSAPFDQNLPVLLALYGIWQRNFMDRPALATLPYAQNLKCFIDYLQQIDMESNGKSVDREGHTITDYKTGPIIFGQVGTNGQHAFHQWLHQGTDTVPCEFIIVETSSYNRDHHIVLNAHASAQATAMFNGEINTDEPHRNYGGQRPSITIQMQDLSPFSLGQLLALYEHKVFVQGIIWNINSFDQWGVELGKKLAQTLLATS
jgi:glucose-6-phosphate isomerase